MVDNIAVGKIQPSIFIADIIGNETVNAHLPCPDRSLINAIRLIIILLSLYSTFYGVRALNPFFRTEIDF
ncbi:hypothetical protein bsdtb5_36400 [Anaeromicropila herbilytica]|uniref:Uncharacterized protein n=1 Tax=Anaeromicropila herbilytica TaxID=2785025 RepID=A0A7R7EPI6_9FIRM|nr:hypothetical protein bsdtb5_36400 [Anaeromicropila herbilytica]